MLRKFFGAPRLAAPPPAVPVKQRVYAIGDIHGRLDLLDALMTRIDADDARRGMAETTLIFLGDLIDRGPDSAAVVERLRSLAATRAGVHFLMGNHEEVLLSVLNGDAKALRLFCRIGGRETAISYGISADLYDRLSYDELVQRLIELVPASHRDFIERFEDMIVIGDYVFVHAGIRPDVPLDQQRSTDLRWIRNPFLDHRRPLEKMVVHGHTIVADVEQHAHRIGIDTGAFETGRLTALGLEADQRWTIST